MIESLNHFSEYWTDLILIASIQNSFYIIIVLGILFLFRDKNAMILRIFVLFGLIKLLIPPLISSSLIPDFTIPALANIALNTTITDLTLINYNVDLTFQSKLMLLWFGGVILILSYSFISTYQFRSSFSQAVLIDAGPYLAGPIPKNIRFYKSNQNHYPIVYGLTKIRIILPCDWEKWSVNQKRIVMIHEINHVIQKDHWINILKLLAFSLHFFNPFVWIILKRMNELNELTCDDSTIAATKSSNIDYSKQLLHFSEWYSDLKYTIPSSLTFTESYKALKKRLSYHLSKKEERNMQDSKLKSRITILICVIVMIPFLGQCDKEQPEFSGQNTSLYSFDDVTVKPEILHKEMPYYPDKARKNGIMGLVVVTVSIDEIGSVIDAEIFSSEDPILNETSLAAAKKCKFKPAEIDGQPVKVKFNIPFKYALR